MRAWRALRETLLAFAITGAIVAALAALILIGAKLFGPWGPLICLPAMFIGFFLLILSDRTLR